MQRGLLHLSSIALALTSTSVAAQGIHVDVHAGLDSLQSDGESQQGASYGLGLGYDIALARALVGVQIDIDATDNRRCEDDVFLIGDRACVDARRDTAINLRAGTIVGGSSLVYATLGYANARFEARYSGAGITTSDHETLDGVRLGAGLSTGIGRRLYAKLEYRYTNYQDGVSRQQGLFGIGIRF
jgi:outer membrane immunogenic protein